MFDGAFVIRGGMGFECCECAWSVGVSQMFHDEDQLCSRRGKGLGRDG